jgi:hypothetical protein
MGADLETFFTVTASAMKILPLQIMGEDQPAPSIVYVHFTFVLSFQIAGRPAEVTTMLASGPLNWYHWAVADIPKPSNTSIIAVFFIENGIM